MMWDLGDERTYTPDGRRVSVSAALPQGTYVQQVEPFRPLVGSGAEQPSTARATAGSVYSSYSRGSASPYVGGTSHHATAYLGGTSHPPSPYVGTQSQREVKRHSYPTSPYIGGTSHHTSPYIDVQPSEHHHHHRDESRGRDVLITVGYASQMDDPTQSHRSHRHRSQPPAHHSHHESSGSQPVAPRRGRDSSVQRPPIYSLPQEIAHVASQIAWKYSRCTGRRKALCIGINYLGSSHELKGCINDAIAVQRFLVDHNYKKEDIVVLRDNASDPRQHPTKQNMIDAMTWLVKGAHQDDSLFFHYSGHGSQVKDRNGDEADGYDEVILPVDYKRAGMITDDLMHEIMVRPLPVGCRLTALFDSCHSGSVLDLPYLYHTDGRLKSSGVNAQSTRQNSSPADVVSFSGCVDSGTSADVVEGNGMSAGAMSHAFIESFSAQPHLTYVELLRAVRRILRDRYKQKPQLSTAHRIDTNLRFII